MKRTVFYALALFTVIVFGFLAYTRSVAPPEGVRIVDGTAKVTGYAMLDENKPEGTYTALDSIPANAAAWLAAREYEMYGFEPHTALGYGDTLNNRHPYYVGFWLYKRTE